MATFYIEQFGCRATHADGAAIERQLRDRGFSVAATPAQADVVVVNTCTVTAAADAQARDSIRKLHVANAASKIIVTGCYAQRAPEDLAKFPGVFQVVGNSHKPQISQLVETIFHKFEINSERSEQINISLDSLAGTSHDAVPYHSAPILVGDIFDLTDVLVAPVLGGEGNHTRPTLKIQDGCNSRCSFCVIPFVRGKSRSLAPEKVISELQRLSASGYLEIVLSGINLGTYGRDLSPRVELLNLLARILDETSVKRLRISSIEPLDVTQDLINLFAVNPRIAPHFHMPLQSASDRILAAMHRWYRSEHYSRRVELIRDRLPNAAIGADIITGFPGETEADHAATLRFIEDRPFTYLHIFSYSARPGTKAASLPNHVSGSTIKRRARELRALADRKSAAFRQSQLGRTLQVLTLRRDPSDDPTLTPALSENFLKVQLPASLPPNQLVNATIEEVQNNTLRCSLKESVLPIVHGAA
jgi:threonylcarbamoyladenosine tRNA methylthiotransferase MtaB